ncbi:hypothetical protein JOQ06_017723, partial [Pogonophryne albipinna]
MCESRAVPSGKVYRQLFDAQVQLSRSLLAGRRDTDCLSAEDSNTTSSRGQQVDDEDDEDVEDVSRLPDSVVVNCPSSDIIERLTEKKGQKHKEALKQLETELTHLTQVCETQVRYVSVELLSSLQDVDLRLNTLKDRMEHLEHDGVQEVCVLWEQVERQVKLKGIRIQELNHKLTESETQRTAEIRAVLRKYLHLLQKISYLPPPDVCRLIHTEATMLNQSLLANRRSVARLLLRLQEENLQQENLLRLHWVESLNRWRRSRVTQVIDRFRWVENQVIDRFRWVRNQVIDCFRWVENQVIDCFRWVRNQVIDCFRWVENQVIDRFRWVENQVIDRFRWREPGGENQVIDCFRWVENQVIDCFRWVRNQVIDCFRWVENQVIDRFRWVENQVIDRFRWREPGYRLLQVGGEPGYRPLQVGGENQVIDCFRWVRNQVIDRFRWVRNQVIDCFRWVENQVIDCFRWVENQVIDRFRWVENQVIDRFRWVENQVIDRFRWVRNQVIDRFRWVENQVIDRFRWVRNQVIDRFRWVENQVIDRFRWVENQVIDRFRWVRNQVIDRFRWVRNQVIDRFRWVENQVIDRFRWVRNQVIDRFRWVENQVIDRFRWVENQVIDRFRWVENQVIDRFRWVENQVIDRFRWVENQVIDRFRALCSSEEEPLLQKLKPDLTKLREDMVYRICFLVPPSCSTVLVSDWFTQLTAINQQIDALHTDFLHQLRCCYEQQWQDRLAEVERCEEALSALQLSEQEVSDIINSQLLTLIGQSQRAALLWETHSRRLETREEEIKQHLEDLRRSQQRNTQVSPSQVSPSQVSPSQVSLSQMSLSQRRKVHLDDLLGALRQGSSEDNLRTNLERCVLYLQDVKHSCTQCVSDQGEVLERLPPLLLEELLSYSSSISSFFHLGHTYTPSPEELQTLLPSSSAPPTPEANDGAETRKPENHPISDQNDTDPAQPSQDWLTEADSSLIDFCDISSVVTFTSARGVAYSGPAFRCAAPDLQQETQLSLFPAELLTHALSRTRTLFLDHMEQRFPDVLSSAVAMMTERKEAVLTEQEVLMQQLHPRHIETHIYLPRLAELQLHRQQVDAHCEEVEEVLSSCRVELQELQSSVRRRNQQLSVRLSNMEEHVLSADSSSRQTVQCRLQEVRSRAAHLLTCFRLFSEGGDFAPQEVKVFQRRLKEETKQINATEESISSELEAFESHSLQQLKEASGSLEEKLSLLKSEVGFMEKIQKIIGSTQVHIKAEVSPDQVLSLLSSVNEEVRKRCQYLNISLEGLSARPKSRKPVHSAPPLGELQTSRSGVDLLGDPVVDIIRSLNSVRRGCRSNMTERGFQVYTPEPELNPHFDQWAESMQQRLLGYHEQSRTLLRTSKE